jgi:hypothetical protein
MIALSGSVDLARHGRIAVRKGLKDDRERQRGTRTPLTIPIDAETKAPKRDFRSPFHPVTMRGGAMTKEP